MKRIFVIGLIIISFFSIKVYAEQLSIDFINEYNPDKLVRKFVFEDRIELYYKDAKLDYLYNQYMIGSDRYKYYVDDKGNTYDVIDETDYFIGYIRYVGGGVKEITKEEYQEVDKSKLIEYDQQEIIKYGIKDNVLTLEVYADYQLYNRSVQPLAYSWIYISFETINSINDILINKYNLKRLPSFNNYIESLKEKTFVRVSDNLPTGEILYDIYDECNAMNNDNYLTDSEGKRILRNCDANFMKDLTFKEDYLEAEVNAKAYRNLKDMKGHRYVDTTLSIKYNIPEEPTTTTTTTTSSTKIVKGVEENPETGVRSIVTTVIISLILLSLGYIHLYKKDLFKRI